MEEKFNLLPELTRIDGLRRRYDDTAFKKETNTAKVRSRRRNMFQKHSFNTIVGDRIDILNDKSMEMKSIRKKK